MCWLMYYCLLVRMSYLLLALGLVGQVDVTDQFDYPTKSIIILPYPFVTAVHLIGADPFTASLWHVFAIQAGA